MRKTFILSMALIFVFSLTAASLAQDDVAKQASCKYCGMDRKTFAHSRMLVIYEDGSSISTCSLHCTAIELALSIDKTPKSIEVGDFKTKKLIDAEKASWVIGGSKPGVMTKRAKWAFESKADADAFIKENGGKLASFDEAIKASYEDMYADTKMIREKRKMMKKAKEPAAHKN
jgi:nitrous oxide reductase accessory protein NosL